MATLKLHAEQMPPAALWHVFPAEGPSELQREVGLGTPVLIVGFPMGFHDELNCSWYPDILRLLTAE